MIKFYDIKDAHLVDDDRPNDNWEVIHLNDTKRMDPFFFRLFRAIQGLQVAKDTFEVQWTPKYLVVDASRMTPLFLRTKGYYVFDYLCRLTKLPDIEDYVQVAIIYQAEVPYPLEPFYKMGS